MGDDFKSRLDAVRARIERAARRAGRDPGGVALVAVSKSVPVERLREAAACGCRVFGENRVQEALTKMEVLGARAPAGIEWHLIGPLQTNKIKAAVGRFALLHAVDRLEVAERLDRAAREHGLTQAILLEVNVAGEKTKHGFSPDELVRLIERMGAFQGIHVLGLMAIPPASGRHDAGTVHGHVGRLRSGGGGRRHAGAHRDGALRAAPCRLAARAGGAWSRSRSLAAGTWARPCWPVSWRTG